MSIRIIESTEFQSIWYRNTCPGLGVGFVDFTTEDIDLISDRQLIGLSVTSWYRVSDPGPGANYYIPPENCWGWIEVIEPLNRSDDPGLASATPGLGCGSIVSAGNILNTRAYWNGVNIGFQLFPLTLRKFNLYGMMSRDQGFQDATMATMDIIVTLFWEQPDKTKIIGT